MWGFLFVCLFLDIVRPTNQEPIAIAKIFTHSPQKRAHLDGKPLGAWLLRMHKEEGPESVL